MTLNELLKELEKYKELYGDKEVTLFAEGNTYPVLATQYFEGEVEMGGGWEPLEYKEENDEN